MDRKFRFILTLAIVVQLISSTISKISLKNIDHSSDVKAFKKILRTKTNVLVIFSKDDKSVLSTVKWLEKVAKDLKGKATFVQVTCSESKDSKKLCKKFSVSPSPIVLKHYKDGSFNKDYDRKHTAKSMLAFMLDPTGDVPWEEDTTANDVVHIVTEKDLNRLRAKHKHPMLIMFYAPWCGHCKRLKPEYSAAATSLKNSAVLAAMDVDKPEVQSVREEFNITGFPTMVFFVEGKPAFLYGGAYNKEGLIEWFKDPKPPKEPEPEVEWKDTPTDVVHLTDATFDTSMEAHQSVLVMFYAPWCGHCKSMKPELVEAAKKMKDGNIDGILAAVDCTKAERLCKKFDVSGYPTVKYFSNGEEKFKVSLRKEQEIVDFMKDPTEPPPPPPEDKAWEESSNDKILHLTDDSFKKELKKKKHVLVMFYAPWCGHCKNAKPEIEEASLQFESSQKVFFAGVDCTIHRATCSSFDVTGYPTFQYFKYGKDSFKYTGGRKASDFIAFMKSPTEGPLPPPPDAEWKDTPSDVNHLTDSTFDEFVSENPSVLVMFYAPWCGHCKKMKPDYQDAAKELLDMKSGGRLAAVDCTQERGLTEKYSINGYPTLKYFKNGQEMKEYDQERTKDSIVTYMLKADGASSQKVDPEVEWSEDGTQIDFPTDKTFDEYIKTNPSTLVMFYAPWCGYCKQIKPDYAEVATIVNQHKIVPGRIAAIDATQYTTLASRFEVKGYPTLKYFKDGKEGKKFDNERNKYGILEFMKEVNRDDMADASTSSDSSDWSRDTEYVQFLTKDSFKPFSETQQEMLVMFYSPHCGHCESLKPNYLKAAEILNTETPHVTLAAVDCHKEVSLAQDHNIDGYPTMVYFSNGVRVMEFKEGREVDDIVSFMQRENKVQRKNVDIDNSRWQDLPSPVLHATPESYFWMLKSKKNSLVMYHRQDSDDCMPARANFMRASSRMKASTEIGFIAIDCGDHQALCNQENINTYPTVKYYEGTVPKDTYTGGMTPEDFTDFLTKHNKKDEL